MGLRRAEQGDRRARARSELDPRDPPRRAGDRRDVPPNGIADAHPPDRLAEANERRYVEERIERAGVKGGRAVDPQHLVLLGIRRVPEDQQEEEPVELRLGERERPFELDRVLGRDDEERVRELVGRLIDGDLALLHRLEEARLCARRRAVDLIDQDDVGHQWAGPVLELAGALVEDGHAGDVRRHEVRCALHAAELEVEGARDRPGERGLPNAGHVIEQDMAFDKQRGEELLHRLVLPDDDAGDLCDEPLGGLLDLVQSLAFGQETR